MLEDVVRDPRGPEEIESSGFAEIIDEFDTYLRSRGYASRTVRFYEQGVVHFARWAGRKKITPSDIAADVFANFLFRHLPRCRCPVPGVRQHHTVRAALRHFEVVLDNGGHRPRQSEKKSTAADGEVERFDVHLRTTCGLRESTRLYRRRYVREFLLEFFGEGEIDVARLNPQDVVAFVSDRASRLKSGSAQVLASSLRSYFRFLRLRGDCDESLLIAVPSTANWKLAGLPTVLTDDEVRRLLEACDPGTATGRRDYAIVRCLTDLGLRAGEVAGLRLEDIDWHNATLRIVGGKSRRDDDLPLPESVGKAIAAYLRRGRPDTTARHVFVRLRAPVGQAASPQLVRNVTRRAAVRADLGSKVTGTRILRHTAATRMLRQGASIKEVADVLRHRCLDTTAIYAKVDLPRLADVAAPWPEDER